MKSKLRLVFLMACFAVPARSWGAANTPPDLVLTVPQGSAEVQTGENITYQFTVDNLGETSSTGVTFRTRTPTEGSFVEFSPNAISCLGDFAPDTKVECDFGVVAPNSPVTLTVVWKAPDVATTLHWDASVDGSGENIADIANNDASVDTSVVQAPPPADTGGGDNAGGTGNNNGGNGAQAEAGGCSLTETAKDWPCSLSLFLGTLGLLGLGRRLARARIR